MGESESVPLDVGVTLRVDVIEDVILLVLDTVGVAVAALVTLDVVDDVLETVPDAVGVCEEEEPKDTVLDEVKEEVGDTDAVMVVETESVDEGEFIFVEEGVRLFERVDEVDVVEVRVGDTVGVGEGVDSTTPCT